MRIRLAACLALLWITMTTLTLARAADAPLSLFFTAEERQKIEALNAARPALRTADEIRLGAVIYFDPGAWTVWINDEAWTPATRKSDLEILDVSPDRVTFRFSPAGAAPREFSLRPYEGYEP